MGGRITSIVTLGLIGVMIAGALRNPKGVRAFAQASSTASKPWLSALLGVVPK